MEDLRIRAAAILARLDATCRNDDYMSWCPFDGLNSRIFNMTPAKNWPLARLIWLQLFKRSPLNMRGLLGVPKVPNAKTFALLARSYDVMDQRLDAINMRHLLLANRCDVKKWGDAAWGYPFPWQARAFYVPQGVPNLIVTAYAVRALAEWHDNDHLIHAAAEFVEKHLWRKEYIAYVPGSDALVHNANLWGAYILAESKARGGRPKHGDMAAIAAATTLNAQRPDGSWIYGTRGHHGWIDGYHMGYNIESLNLLGKLLKTDYYEQAISRGLDFYKNNMFEPSGLPKHYHNNPYPVEPECAAQAILTLLTVRKDAASVELADRILAWTLDNLWLEDKGHFAYLLYRSGYKNSINYLRWTQSWMHLALSIWLKNRPHSCSK